MTDKTAPTTDRGEFPDLLSVSEQQEILLDAEILWSELQKNELGGFSGQNRPFYILHAFKTVIEKYGKRDVGLKWSNNDLDAARLAEKNAGE